MESLEEQSRPVGSGLSRVYYVLFRHKWKILVLTLFGVIAAGVIFLNRRDLYFSEAKLFIRYVVESRNPTLPGTDTQIRSTDSRGDSIIASEMDILQSMDLLLEVVRVVGPTRVLAGANMKLPAATVAAGVAGGGANAAAGTNSVGGTLPPGVASGVLSTGFRSRWTGEEVAAAVFVRQNLFVDVPKKSQVVRLAMRHPDPAVAKELLLNLIEGYQAKHLRIHKQQGVFDSFLDAQVDELQSKVMSMEKDLANKRMTIQVAGTVDDTKKIVRDEWYRVREEAQQLEAELAQREAQLKIIQERIEVANAANRAAAAAAAAATSTNASSTAGVGTNAVAGVSTATTNAPVAAIPLVVPREKENEYRDVLARLLHRRGREQELSAQFKPTYPQLKAVLEEIAELEAKRSAIEREFPQIGKAVAPVAASNAGYAAAAPQAAGATPAGQLLPDPAAYLEQIAGLRARYALRTNLVLRKELEYKNIEKEELLIAENTRELESNKTKLRFFEARREEARIDKQLGPGTVSSIGEVQSPTEAVLVRGEWLKFMLIALASGLFGGIALAFLTDTLFDQSVRHNSEIETTFKLPLYVSIPKLAGGGSEPFSLTSLPPPKAGGGEKRPGDSAVPATEVTVAVDTPEAQELQMHHDALRDKVVRHFEIEGLTRKPKLVAVTGAHEGGGVTTTAAGLAASLSEVGDGAVLLVDMTKSDGDVHPFLRGRPAQQMALALQPEKRGEAMVSEKLYMVSTETAGGWVSSRMVPKKFAEMFPRLKASDYDYIVFDMPPVTQTSVTTKLAGYMDLVLFVAEAERTGRAEMKEAVERLKDTNARAAVVLNKKVSRIPKWLGHEL